MKVNFSFYAIETWLSYKLCPGYELDLGNIAGTFKSAKWNNDMNLETSVSRLEEVA